MGEDKALIEIDGVPLWERQLRVLRELTPRELFIAGPARDEWHHAGCIIIADAQPNAGPLAGLVAALRHCTAPLLLALAVDLPRMTADYLREMMAVCSETSGILPRGRGNFEPMAAVYPLTALPLAESCLASGNYSMQRFAARCLSQGLASPRQIAPDDEPLFLNMNTPQDLLAVTNA